LENEPFFLLLSWILTFLEFTTLVFVFKGGSTFIGGGFSFSNVRMYEQVEEEEAVLSNLEGLSKLLT
jgi:hypothetical protein